MLNLSDILRGYTDTIILARLVGSDSYGYDIARHIQEMTDGMLRLKEATLYTTFRRMEESELIESYWGDGLTGARRRYYHLTQKGRALYDENCADWRRYSAMISNLIESDRA